MNLGKRLHAQLNKAIKGFDGGLYEKDGRQYVVTTTHGWGMRINGEWVVAVVFAPAEPRAGDLHSYVLPRDEFLAEFTKAEPDETVAG